MTSDVGILGALKRKREVILSVKGRVTGRVSSRHVWFALSKNEKSIYLIPVNGRKTQWYLNVRKEPRVTIRVGAHAFTEKIAEVEQGKFRKVSETFAAKYGKDEMEAYYPRKEVALEVPLPASS